MCVTCGCSADSDVRITDPATGKTTTLRESNETQGHPAHQHTDASGHSFTHAHPAPEESTDLADADSRGQL